MNQELVIALAPYEGTFTALGGLATLMLVQLLVADVIGILRKHTPGTAIPNDHSDVHFRANRALQNLNESALIPILVIALGLYRQVDAVVLASLTWGYVGARATYAVCYYANWQKLRSATFAVSLIFILCLLVLGSFG